MLGHRASREGRRARSIPDFRPVSPATLVKEFQETDWKDVLCERPASTIKDAVNQALHMKSPEFADSQKELGRERGTKATGEKDDESPGEASGRPPTGPELLEAEGKDVSRADKFGKRSTKTSATLSTLRKPEWKPGR